MATINTVEDLLRLLDENPQWAEALRARLLTRELTESPERFAAFADQTNRQFEGVDRRFDAVDQRFERLESAVEGLRVDIGSLKAAHARNAAIREVGLIAADMGFTLVRVLSFEDAGELIRGQDTSGIPPNALRSFRRGDLIMDVMDGEGNSCYVAVEVAFTANGRDTGRAIRNAGYLTRFTGLSAFAAVASLSPNPPPAAPVDGHIRGIIDAGSMFWYEMDAEALEVE